MGLPELYAQLYAQLAQQLGSSTTFGSALEAAGAALLGGAWGGVHAADELPERPAQRLTLRVVNTGTRSSGGVHWLACAEHGSRRVFNDPLGSAGAAQRRDLLRRHPDAALADDDAEQQPQERDCGVRALVALAIAAQCGLPAFEAL